MWKRTRLKAEEAAEGSAALSLRCARSDNGHSGKVGGGAGLSIHGAEANVRKRRILLVAASSSQGLLTECRPAAKPWRRELAFMPPFRPFTGATRTSWMGWVLPFGIDHGGFEEGICALTSIQS